MPLTFDLFVLSRKIKSEFPEKWVQKTCLVSHNTSPCEAAPGSSSAPPPSGSRRGSAPPPRAPPPRACAASGGTGRRWRRPQEVRNTLLCPSQEKVHSVVFKRVRKFLVAAGHVGVVKKKLWRSLKSTYEISPVKLHSGYFGTPEEGLLLRLVLVLEWYAKVCAYAFCRKWDVCVFGIFSKESEHFLG